MQRRALFPLQSVNHKETSLSPLKMAQAAPKKKLSHADKVKARENIEPQRFALIFDPPSVVLEYRDKARDSLRHRKMQIPSSCLHNVDLAVQKLVRHNNIHLHPSVVSKEQVQRLVEKLITPPAQQAGSSQRDSKKISDLPPVSSHTSDHPPVSRVSDPISAPGGVVGNSDPFALIEPVLDKHDVMTGALDLNKADDDVVKKAKEIMEEDFETNQVKPGDAGFVYDKREEFEAVEGDGEWDDEDSDGEVLSPGMSSGQIDSPMDSPLDTGDNDNDMYDF